MARRDGDAAPIIAGTESHDARTSIGGCTSLRKDFGNVLPLPGFATDDRFSRRKITVRVKNFLREHKLSISAVACVALVGVIVFVAHSRSQQRPAQTTRPPSEVEVVQVEQRDVPVYSEWIGTTDGMVNAEIRAQVSGYLLRKNYAEGAYVRKGQLLFEIDHRPLQAALDQALGKLAQAQGQLGQANSQLVQYDAQVGEAEAQVSQAQAQVTQQSANQLNTQLDLNKYKPLREQKAVTQQELDNADQPNRASIAQVEAAQAGVKMAQAQVRAAQAQVGTAKAAITSAKAAVRAAEADVETARLNLGFTKILSPIDGIAGIAQAQVGDLVGPNGTASLTTVSTVNPIKVYFTVNEREYLNYAKRDTGRSGRDVALNNDGSQEVVLLVGGEAPKRGSRIFCNALNKTRGDVP